MADTSRYAGGPVEVRDENQIAIVGMSCRLPGGVYNPRDLLDFCTQARYAWSPIPEDRFNARAYYHPDHRKEGYVHARGGAFLQHDVKSFDAPFFGVTQREAEALDPQHRQALECAYEAFEDAGLPLSSLKGQPMGVFAAMNRSDYDVRNSRDLLDGPQFNALGVQGSMFANQLSYHFDLRGPSLSVDTACSSSLHCLHLAVQSIRSGTCRSALVSGSILHLDPSSFTMLASLGILGADGRSYAYDKRGHGYGRGEGCVCLVLKPLADALKDGDVVRAVIRGSNINHNGKTPGIANPSSVAQAELIKETYDSMGLNVLDTDYVEGHGTGTAVGDPLEVNAVVDAFTPQQRQNGPLYLGSLKSQFGHLEGTSGLLSVAKCVLMLENKVILPNGDFQEPNDALKLDERNMRTLQRAIPWETCKTRRASINNFGFGGSNAHVILEEAFNFRTGEPRNNLVKSKVSGAIDGYIKGENISLENGVNGTDINVTNTNATDVGSNDVDGSAVNGKAVDGLGKTVPGVRSAQQGESILAESQKPYHPIRLFPLSVRQGKQLQKRVSDLAQYLKALDPTRECQILDDLSFTLCQRREHFPHRFACSASTLGELMEKLGQGTPTAQGYRAPKIGFVFTGQGAQWHGMGKELLVYEEFATSIQEAEDTLKQLGADWSLQEELWKDPKCTRLGEAAVAQPAVTALQLSLFLLLESLGIRPQVCVGHSSGEIAAAYAVGKLDFKSTLAIAYHRGLTASRVQKFLGEKVGAMLAVGAPPSVVDQLLEDVDDGEAIIACYNSPSSVTVSGDAAAVEQVRISAERRGLFNRKLRVDVAYHSQHMQLVAAEYLEAIREYTMTDNNLKPSMTFFSSVTGRRMDADRLDANYWVTNLTSPVLFEPASRALLTQNASAKEEDCIPDVLIELGPAAALKGPIQEIIKSLDAKSSSKKISYLSVLERNRSAEVTLMDLTALLFTRGLHLNFARMRPCNHTSPVSTAKTLHDLPVYPWARDKQYWFRSRITDAVDRNDVEWNMMLGMKDQSSPNGASFRNVFTLDDLPFLRDHKLDTTVLFPGAGFLCMALEACRQAAKSHKQPVSGYVLREVKIARALPLVEDTTYEMVTTLTRLKDSTRGSPSDAWFEFHVYSSVQQNGLQEHCSGYASLVDEKPPNPVDRRVSQHESPNHMQHRKVKILQQVNTKIDSERFYQSARLDQSFDFGPTFQGLSNVKLGPAGGLFQLTVVDIAHLMPQQFTNQIIIHPGTLDSVLQAGSAPVSDTKESYGWIPTFIEHCYVSDHIPVSVGAQAEILTYDSAILPGSKTATSSMFVTDGSDYGNPMIHIKGMQLYASHHESADALQVKAQTASKVVWQPQFDLLERSELEAIMQLSHPEETELSAMKRLQEAAHYYLERVSTSKVSPSAAGHMPKLTEWIKKVVQSEVNGTQRSQRSSSSWTNSSEARRNQYLENISHSDYEGRVLCQVGENLTAIVDETSSPLCLLAEGGLLAKYYEDGQNVVRGTAILQNAVRLLGHQNPALKILEVGAGTGGMALPILSALTPSDNGVPCFAKYDFTDSSDASFEGASRKLQQWEDLVEYKKLDISIDPLAQGYTGYSYDLIIAALVLHKAPTLVDTLRNLRKLLRPSGKLLLLEITAEAPALLFPLTILPGWWSAADSRDFGPGLLPEHWDAVLRESGFSGLDACVDEYSTPGTEFAHCMSVLCSTALWSGTKNELAPVVMVMDKAAEDEVEGMISSLNKCLNVKVHKANADIVDLEDSTVICVTGKDSEYMTKATAEQFLFLQSLFTRPKAILWIIQGTYPDAHFVPGFCRTLRLESSATKIVTLQLQHDVKLEDEASLIARVFRHAFLEHPDPFGSDVEFAVVDGIIHTSRILPDKDLTDFMHNALNPDAYSLQPLRSDRRSLKLATSGTGSFDKFHFKQSDFSLGQVGDDKVELSIRAVGMNFKDLLIAMGEVPWQDMGLECSGVVTAVGSNVRDLSVGQRVLHWGPGCYASHVQCSPEAVAPIPEKLTFEAAASIPIVFATAWICLVDQGRLEQGERVLIHAGSGGVGQAAIMIAQMIGAEVYTTVGSAEKRDFLVETYGFQQDHIFYSRDATFASAVMEATDGKGVDVLLNSLSGESLRQSWRCMADLGRFVEIGKRDALANRLLEMSNFDRAVSYISVDLGVLGLHKPLTVKRTVEKVLQLMESSTLKPVQPIVTVPMSTVEQGLRIMQQGKHMGKIVVVADESTTVRAIRLPEDACLFRPDASYCITGGTGGLGLAATRWMMDHGARNIILVSRSGAQSQGAKDMIAEGLEKGARVEIKACDVGNFESLNTTLSECMETMPPIRGVIHGPLALHDQIFESSAYEDWEMIINSRVQGTWNLHNLFKAELDFFVCLASSSGIAGNRGQASYAGSNSFMDAFCRWRASQGLVASSLDLPFVYDIGYFTKREDQDEMLRQLQTTYGEGMDEKGFLALFKATVSDMVTVSTANQCQAIMGDYYSTAASSAIFEQDNRFAYARRMNLAAGAAPSSGSEMKLSIKQVVQGATTYESVFTAIFNGVADKISSMMLIPVEDITPKKAMSAYGLDSLVIVEFRNWLRRELDATIPMIELLNSASLERLVENVIAKSKVVEDSGWGLRAKKDAQKA